MLVNSKGEILTWKKFVETSKKIKENANKELMTEGFDNIPTSFASMEEAEQFFRARGGITMEELDNKIMELKYGNDDS